MFGRILKKDLKRNKTMNIILFLFVIIASADPMSFATVHSIGDGKSIKITFEEEDDYKLLCVANSGTVPDETDMQSLFDSFSRGKNTEGIQGSGLGLYICKNLMHKMDGDVYAEASDGLFKAVAVVKMA